MIKQTGATGCILTPVHASAPGSGQLGRAPIAFFAPDNSFAVGQQPGAAALELKQVVKGFHEAGIEVIIQARSLLVVIQLSVHLEHQSSSGLVRQMGIHLSPACFIAQVMRARSRPGLS